MDLKNLYDKKPKGQRQHESLFIEMLAALIEYAISQGYELTLGEGLRLDHKGHMAGSNHYKGLAQDLNLFVNGIWQKTECKEWDDLGTYWKTLHPLARWGGDFMTKNHEGKLVPVADLNHFGVSFEGVA